MRSKFLFALAALAVVLAACAPATVHPQQRVSDMSFSTAYQEAVKTINTEPYPSNTGGWVITQSDQNGGFITAELSMHKCGFLGLGCHPYTAQVSVTLVSRSNGTTAVNIGRTNDDQAKSLATDLLVNLHTVPGPG